MNKPTRILVPIDFSPGGVTALEEAVRLGRLFGASIDALHVWSPARDCPPERAWVGSQGGCAGKADWEELERFLAPVKGAGGTRIAGRIEYGDPVEAILRTAGEEYDLVVMGTHGRGVWSRLLSASVAEAVVRGASCPVMTVHIPEPAARQEMERRLL